MFGRQLHKPAARYGSLSVILLAGASFSVSSLLVPPPRNFLSTEGSRIIDSRGQEVTITGVEWFGFETADMAPDGLWGRTWGSLLDQVAELGFNTVRLPYSNQALEPASKPQNIDYGLNPDLRGLTSLQVLDRLVEGAGKRGLRVVLERSRPSPELGSGLWYDDTYDEARWIADWRMLAGRYRGNSTVVGADLHNEPRDPATWGSGELDTDWRLAAERAGNAILEVNPEWLIFVQGIDRSERGPYWWGGSLAAAADHPVRLDIPNKLVYSSHDYGPSIWPQEWFEQSDFPANLPDIWQHHWAHLLTSGTAPVLLAHGGSPSLDTGKDAVWWMELMAFLRKHRVHYTFWTLGPNGMPPGGLFNDDWRLLDAGKIDLLRWHQAPLMR